MTLRLAIGVLLLTSPCAFPAPQEAAPGCGYISTSAKPPLADDIFPANIRRIDGRDTPKRALNRYRLDAGRHAIAIQEHIGSIPRGYTALRKLGNREVPLVYKIIHIDVEAGRSYQMGAKLHRDQLKPSADSAYWTPVIWRISAEACE